MAKDIAVYVNDFADSDNWAAAEMFQRFTARNPSVRSIWIAESRHVSFGSSMTREQVDGCTKLLKTHFPFYDSTKTLLCDALPLSDFEKLEGLSKDDLELLKFAVRPANGPREDAITHARLIALDLMTVLRCRSHSPINIFVDCDALDSLESPVNLHMHHHDELVARTKTELAGYQDIMDGRSSERVRRLRSWYQQALKTKLKEHEDAIHDLDVDMFCRILKVAGKVTFFGARRSGFLNDSSVKELEGIWTVICKLCGTFNIALNQVGNQYNIALNPGAARFVFSSYREFSGLTLIPTDTTKQVEYSLVGLRDLSPSIARGSLAFNCRVEAMRLITSVVSVDGFPHKKIFLPDLTAFSFAFTKVFEISTLEFVNVVDVEGQLILISANSGISVFKLPQNIVVEKPEDFLESFE